MLSRPEQGPNRRRLGVSATSTRGRTPGRPMRADVGSGSVQRRERAGHETPATSVPCRGALTTEEDTPTRRSETGSRRPAADISSIEGVPFRLQGARALLRTLIAADAPAG